VAVGSSFENWEPAAYTGGCDTIQIYERLEIHGTPFLLHLSALELGNQQLNGVNRHPGSVNLSLREAAERDHDIVQRELHHLLAGPVPQELREH